MELKERIAKAIYYLYHDAEKGAMWDRATDAMQMTCLREAGAILPIIEEQVAEAVKAERERSAELLNKLDLYVGEAPKEGTGYTHLGCYILNWGNGEQPTLGFNHISDSKEWDKIQEEVSK